MSIPTTHDDFVTRRNKLITSQPIRPIGGSDLVSILNLDSSYGSPYKAVPVFRAHPQLPSPKKVSVYMLDGQRYEFVARILWTIMFPDDPLAFDVTQLYWTSDTCIPYLVSTDGLLPLTNRVFEVKTLAKHNEESFTLANQEMPYGLPLKYIPQLELYMQYYKCHEAVMMFLMPNEGNHREVYDAILEDPLDALNTITADQARMLCFTRIYQRTPTLDVWMWIQYNIMHFWEMVFEHGFNFTTRNIEDAIVLTQDPLKATVDKKLVKFKSQTVMKQELTDILFKRRDQGYDISRWAC